MVENVGEDGIELKPAKSKVFGEASDVASGDVKPTKQVGFKVKIPFQAHIVQNQAKPVFTGNFEEKPKPVPTGVRVIEVTPGHFLQQLKDGETVKNYLVGFVDKRQGPNLLFL